MRAPDIVDELLPASALLACQVRTRGAANSVIVARVWDPRVSTFEQRARAGITTRDPRAAWDWRLQDRTAAIAHHLRGKGEYWIS